MRVPSVVWVEARSETSIRSRPLHVANRGTAARWPSGFIEKHAIACRATKPEAPAGKIPRGSGLPDVARKPLAEENRGFDLVMLLVLNHGFLLVAPSGITLPESTELGLDLFPGNWTAAHLDWGLALSGDARMASVVPAPPWSIRW